MHADLAPERLLAAYAVGIFPMADDDGELHWLAPDPRTVINLDSFTVSRSLRVVVQRGVFEVSVNRAFAEVVSACADRPEGTWISAEIAEAYSELHRLGFCHSIEAWKDDRLAGGLYGVALAGAFFGESMFYRVTDASKVALVKLVERMRDRGFKLLDVQFATEHLRRFGAVEIPRREYERRLAEALRVSCWFDEAPGSLSRTSK
ncbi:MAG: leucyl/phenylalanyl-tRNA--protein transferase [Phycisphaerales bacterium]|nr:MAG: leucyl/phenylalanyl-tRNA--protein transferase [Phycisphaerales bacterium]